jgi:signal transduction histidine kinase
MFEAAPDGRLVRANPALARLFGCVAVEEFLDRYGRAPGLLFADARARESFLTLLRERGRAARLEGEAVGKDGRRLRIAVSGWAAASGDAAPAVQGIVEDVTDQRREIERRKLAERMLAGKILLLQRMLDAVDFGVCAYDKDSRLSVWNERYLEQAHRDPMVRVGMPLVEHFKLLARLGHYGSGPRDEAARQRLRRLQARGFLDRETLRRPDGRIVEVRYAPLKEGGFVATFADVTERSRTEDQMLAAKELAELANRSKTAFLGHLSHDLRTPLNNVLAFAEIIKDRRLADERDRYVEYAGYIFESGRELLRLIDDIIDVAQIESGEFALKPGEVDVGPAIAGAHRLVGDEMQKKGIQFIARVPDDCPKLAADEKSLKQILVNLLSNASRFTPRGGRVILDVRPQEDGHFLIRVSDTGSGMAKGQIAAVMSPFGAPGAALALDRATGGIGLRLVKYLIERHGGRLDISSMVGVGTTVTLRFPLAPPSSPPAA